MRSGGQKGEGEEVRSLKSHSCPVHCRSVVNGTANGHRRSASHTTSYAPNENKIVVVLKCL